MWEELGVAEDQLRGGAAAQLQRQVPRKLRDSDTGQAEAATLSQEELGIGTGGQPPTLVRDQQPAQAAVLAGFGEVGAQGQE
ncbi:MAG: hypothetical protein M3024_00910 [Candidatus Dormibacteraeota bacterium]|nr:hypothetical protein [Candidatus Dormibacteraeota bacterium]